MKDLKSQNGNTPMHIAASRGNFDICKFIIENIDDKNPANNNGITSLHIAAHNGELGICKEYQLQESCKQ